MTDTLIKIGAAVSLLLILIAISWFSVKSWHATERFHRLFVFWIGMAILVIPVFTFIGWLLNTTTFGTIIGAIVFVALMLFTGNNYVQYTRRR